MKSKNGILGTLIIRDSSALINPNTLVSITEVKPVNLSELEEKEKLELAFQYQYFIRSLTFPIQIVLRFVNKDCEKFLYRKRMADVEELIKKAYKKNSKDVIAESDEFKKWLKPFLESKVRPMILCYIVIPVLSQNNLASNEMAYIEALQLLNQRTEMCISRLSSIKFRKKIKSNVNRSDWEEHQFERVQEKKALTALKMFRHNSSYYSHNNFKIVNNGKKKVSEYIKSNFFDELSEDQEISLELNRLDDERISNLFDSYCKDFVVLKANGHIRYFSVKDLFSVMINKNAEVVLE